MRAQRYLLVMVSVVLTGCFVGDADPGSDASTSDGGADGGGAADAGADSGTSDGSSDGGSSPGLDSVDILFVIDDSGSMEGEQNKLVSAVDTLVDILVNENSRRLAAGAQLLVYRAAVTTTSVGLTYDLGTGPVTITTYNIPAGFDCRTPQQLMSGDPYPAGRFVYTPGNSAVLDSEVLGDAEFRRELKSNLQVGVCGSGQEQGLFAALEALRLNPSFRRSQSRLVVVFVSDEEDCSDPDLDTILSVSEDVCVREARLPSGGTLGPVSNYVDAFTTRDNDVVVGVIASATGTPPDLVAAVCTDAGCEAACGSPNPQGAPCYCGGQSGGSRFLELAGQIEIRGVAAVRESVCAPNLDRFMQQLGDAIVSP